MSDQYNLHLTKTIVLFPGKHTSEEYQCLSHAWFQHSFSMQIALMSAFYKNNIEEELLI